MYKNKNRTVLPVLMLDLIILVQATSTLGLNLITGTNILPTEQKQTVAVLDTHKTHQEEALCIDTLCLVGCDTTL